MSETEDTRCRLLAVAGPIFAERGFEHTTVRQICLAADVNLAAINYYFGDKKTLYVETVHAAHSSLVERVPMPEWPADTPAPMKLRGFVGTLLTRMLSRDAAEWQPRLMLREILQPTDACRALIEDYFVPVLQFLESILAEIIAAPVPRHHLRQMAFSIVGQCLFYRVSREVVNMIISDEDRDAHYQTRQLAEHIASFSLAALGQTPLLSSAVRNEEVLKP